jgi:hypothetical protein
LDWVAQVNSERQLEEVGGTGLRQVSESWRPAKPQQQASLADTSRSLGTEKWVPMPKFFFREYLKAYPQSVLVALLLYYQHFHWRQFSWVGVPTLSKRTGWSHSSVYKAIHVMGHKHKWDKLHTGLPFPLQIDWSNGANGHRRFKVRFADYDPKRKRVFLSDEFAEHFSRKPTSARQNVSASPASAQME